MLERVNVAKLSRDIEKRTDRGFPGGTLNYLKHHIKPSITKTPDRFVIHCGINNLDSESTPVEIVNDITDLGNAVKMKKKNKKKTNESVILRFVHAKIILIKRHMK